MVHDSSSILIDETTTDADIAEERRVLDELLKHVTVGGSKMTRKNI
jgi:ABC-type Na+ transport system ATPase subunit NatA